MQERTDPLPPQFSPTISQPGPLSPSSAEPDPKQPKYNPSIDAGGALRDVDAPRYVPTGVEIVQWRGMYTNMNKHILRDQYTARQYNLMSVVFGQVQVRGGIAGVTFD